MMIQIQSEQQQTVQTVPLTILNENKFKTWSTNPSQRIRLRARGATRAMKTPVNPFKARDMVVNNSEYERSIRNRDFIAVKPVRGNMMSDLRESELQSQNIKPRSKEWDFIPTCYTIQQDVKTWCNRFKLFAEQNDINSNDLRNCLASFMDDRCLQRFEYRVPKGPKSLFELEKYMVSLFEWQPASQTDSVAEFYNRIQLPGEDYRNFQISVI
ncbi:unnamed protein product [Brachionus calyciflorus]|uniref:Uncharacterized protein n=1 Tax=Brachionus calyciflorus TaxID=104777 RepID=A0A814KKX6_9BILA|nr:unnamed protein product [Brachionus calyciflorus]